MITFLVNSLIFCVVFYSLHTTLLRSNLKKHNIHPKEDDVTRDLVVLVTSIQTFVIITTIIIAILFTHNFIFQT